MTTPCRAATLPKRNQDEKCPVSQLPSGVAAGMVFQRVLGFESLDEMLDWSERYAVGQPLCELGPDGRIRGSVRTR